MPATDTIVALSTPPGRSGIGVIRLSGAEALPLVRQLLREQEFHPEANRAYLRSLCDPVSGEFLDRALVTFFKSPHSFTGEDVVELSCHGSPPLLLHLLDALLARGARAAAPGEFTFRALVHGKLNLSQAEAVRDLIDAQTDAAVRQAARQLGGELSARLKPHKDALVNIIVPLESSLEFVEDDLPHDLAAGICRKLSSLMRELEELAGTFRRGRLLKEGLRVALVGRPNVGKSSIFNGLLESDRSIVTHIPGTTRDSISEVLSIEGIPVLLTDTAGVRSATDEVEQLGIERTQRAVADADLVLIVLDGSHPFTEEDRDVFRRVSESRHVVAVNKLDLDGFSRRNVEPLLNGSPVIEVSARTRSGFEELRAALVEPFTTRGADETNFVITNARHFDLIRRAIESLHSAECLLNERASEELVLVGLYDALKYLGEITGETTAEDVLTQIFSTFCIGK